QRSTLAISEERGFAPGRERVQLACVGTVGHQVAPVHVHAIGAAVDLRHPQKDKIDQAPAERASMQRVGNIDQLVEHSGSQLEVGDAYNVRHEISLLKD